MDTCAMKQLSAVTIVLLTLTTAAVALYSWQFRRDMFNTMAPGHEWLTASTVIFARNWYVEGALKLRLLQLWNPRSIEFPDIASRQVYVSAPPGTVIPIYITSCLLGTEPSVAIVHGYNLVSHCLITLTLALTVYYVLRSHSFTVFSCSLMACAAICFFLLFPVNMYGFQNIFYSDQAVVLPVALFVLMEVMRGKQPSWALSAAQSLVLLWGCYTDWYMWVVAGVAYILRLALAHTRWSMRSWLLVTITFWTPAILALLLFLAQLSSQHMLAPFLKRITVHSALADNATLPWQVFLNTWWGEHVSKFYGKFSLASFIWLFISACLVVLAACVDRLCHRHNNESCDYAVRLLALAALPPVLYTHSLRNYAYPHDFSTHKFSVTVALVLFAALPLMGMCIMDAFCDGKTSKRGQLVSRLMRESCILLPFLLVVAVNMLYASEMWRYRPAHIGRRSSNPFEPLGTFLRQATRYDDLVVSPHIEIGSRPPQFLSYSNKRVYLTENTFRALSKVMSAGDQVQHVAVLVGTNGPGDFSSILAHAYDVQHGSDCTLYRIRRGDLDNYVSACYADVYQHMLALHAEFSKTTDYDVVYLADLHSVRAANFTPGRYGIVNWGHTGLGENLHQWGFACRKALVAHAPVRGHGEVRIALRPQYKLFRTILTLNSPDGCVSYGMRLDDREVFSSGPLSGRSLAIFVEVNVAGHRELVLTLDPCGSHANDEAVWVDPHFLLPRTR